MTFEDDRVCPACEVRVAFDEESCPNCGTYLGVIVPQPSPPDSEPVTGLPQQQITETPEIVHSDAPVAPAPLCPSCKRPHPSSARYCSHCGSKLVQLEEKSSVIPEIDDVQVQEEGQPQQEEPVLEDLSPNLKTLEHPINSKTPSEDSRRKKWGILAFAAIVIFVGVILLRSNNEESFGLPIASQTPVISQDPTSIPSATLTETPPPTHTPTNTLTPTPTFSPSATKAGKIVFTCQIFKDEQRNQICLINADRSGWIRLTKDDYANHFYPSLSPDGTAIVYSANSTDYYQIYEMDIQEGKQTQLTHLDGASYAPAISPNGRLIVFTYVDDAHQTIWLMDRDGDDPHLLTRGEGDAWDAAWSPSGDAILFASGSASAVQLFIIDVDGSNLRRITNTSNLRGRSDWSPDGTILATYIGTSWNREIFLLDTDGSNMRQITSGGNNLAPNFSPDGRWIAFTSYWDNYKNDNGCEIYIKRINDGEVIRLTENDYCDWQPHWGP